MELDIRWMAVDQLLDRSIVLRVYIALSCMKSGNAHKTYEWLDVYRMSSELLLSYSDMPAPVVKPVPCK